ncbi:MAG: SLBB domain-containing protein [Deltaproteobacteria bacterium]|nr:SLBB domain-containing protein [Deltaproteobacteria bacterium]
MTVKRLTSPEDLAAWRGRIGPPYKQDRVTFVVSNGTCGQAAGSMDVLYDVHEAIEKLGAVELADIRATGCHGFCAIEPLILVQPAGVLYPKVKSDDVRAIVEASLRGEVLEKKVYKDTDGARYARESELPYYRKQNLMISGPSRWVDPLDIETYVAGGGYDSLVKAFAMGGQAVIDEAKAAGLRGRGGGGFLAARKWQSVRDAHGEPKYLLCNADEGDPGAYMDRALLEGNPHLVIEGMIIAAHAIGATQGYVYVRHEYPVAVKNLTAAIKQAREADLLGKNILGSGHDFDINVSRGGGAFVCGESTALMASIEGKPGEPRPKYVHTAESGLWGKPSNLNNVETFANVPWIVANGAASYAKIGTDTSKGTKIFSLVGKVNHTGLIEVPMGTTLREIVEDIGGGVPDGRSFKAVQTGGPSGGCLPADRLDMPVGFDKLWDAGTIMGSGGMIVMDDHNCMVDIAR